MVIKPPIELPQYRSHKVVRAAKIARIILHPDDSATIVPVLPTLRSFPVLAEYVAKHHPEAGGYYVVYDDDYESWSPQAAFETGYTLINPTP